MLLHQAQEILTKSGFLMYDNVIVKKGMTYGFYTTETFFKGHSLIPDKLVEVRTCSREVATLMVINNVSVKKY